MTVELPTVSKLANAAWHRYRWYHPVSAEDPLSSFVFAWKRATTNAIDDRYGFATWAAQLKQLVDLLERLFNAPEDDVDAAALRRAIALSARFGGWDVRASELLEVLRELVVEHELEVMADEHSGVDLDTGEVLED